MSYRGIIVAAEVITDGCMKIGTGNSKAVKKSFLHCGILEITPSVLTINLESSLKFLQNLHCTLSYTALKIVCF